MNRTSGSYGPLNDSLPIERRQVSFSVPFARERSVKDAIERWDDF